MKTIDFTTEDIKQVFLSLSCNYVSPYWLLEQETKIPKNKLKLITKELKYIWVIEISTWFYQDSWLIAGKGFSSFSDKEIKAKYKKGEISNANWQKFLLIMD